jgi:two-component system nitrogen regulation sensor histidine kinase NtrY
VRRVPAGALLGGGPVRSRRAQRRQQMWLGISGVVIVLLTAAVVVLGSSNLPFRIEQGSGFVILFALSTLIGAALLVFSLILSRTLLKLWAERRSGQLGSRFKVKMVAGAMGVSLLPLVFLFFFSYALVNRTLNAWFPRPLEIANEQSAALLDNFSRSESDQLNRIAHEAVGRGAVDTAAFARDPAVDAFWLNDASGKVIQSSGLAAGAGQSGTAGPPELAERMTSGAQIWKAGGKLFIAGNAPAYGGTLFVTRRLPDDFLNRYTDSQAQTLTYFQQKQRLRSYKREILLVLMLITLLLVFATTWVALFLSKQVTVPIQSLAEATREISRGNFDHRIEVQAQDELGTLVRSFNRMTEQLGEGRRQINEFTRNLEEAVEERERRRKLMEAILENIPTGVVSLGEAGEVARVNPAMVQILGEYAREAKTLTELLGEEAAKSVQHLMRRSLRMGAASREIEIATGGKLVRTAVTVSSLGPRRSNPGFVVVIDDLTELLQAQKAAAWQEVAQRIAHEIKNPLTPIQLSAQRLLRYLGRSASVTGSAGSGTRANGAANSELEKLVAECAGLIEREVQTLESLVGQFSEFARFPAARLAPADLNSIVTSALELFKGRLEGVSVRVDLAPSRPAVKADPELMRRVMANLIDNAAEAMEGSSLRQLRIATRLESDGDAAAIEVSDTGYGISPEDKSKLFLPHFSTKDRGTGLGLAIASRIVAEHNGTMRVEDNLPFGARFIIRLPALETSTVAPATPQANSSPTAA